MTSEPRLIQTSRQGALARIERPFVMIKGRWAELKRYIVIIVIDGDFNTLPSGTRGKKEKFSEQHCQPS